LERAGVPVVAFIGDKFEPLGKSVARALGIPDLCYVTVPHPINRLSEDEVVALAHDRYPLVVRALSSTQA
jgi:hypothetical protein